MAHLTSRIHEVIMAMRLYWKSDGRGERANVLASKATVSPRSYSYFLFVIGFHYVACAGHQLNILLPLPPKFWDSRHVTPYLAFYATLEVTLENPLIQNTFVWNGK